MIVVYDNRIYMNGKNMGTICRDGIFRIFGRDKEKHLFKMYNGWGVNKEVLDYLRKRYIELIEIKTTDNEIYKTNIMNFYEHGIGYKNPKGEKDMQIILPLEYWLRVRSDGRNRRPLLQNRKVRR